MTGRGRLEARIVVRRQEGFTLDLELAIEPGATVALLGPNGSGKSTTVDAIAGIRPLDDGRITLGDRVLDDPSSGVWVPPEQRRVGVVFQRILLFDHLDVAANIAFGPTAAGRSRRDVAAIVAQWIETFDLGPLAHRRPAGLSGGEAQRVALARALAADPEVLLLDEPLAAIDVAGRARLRRVLLDHLGDYPGPRLLITHDPADAFLFADRVHVLEHGRVSQTGTMDDVRRRPATAYVAALAGLNLLTGTNAAGLVTLDEHPVTLRSADTHTAGPVLVTIPPAAIALHAEEPHGSPRNTWSTSIAAVEPLGETSRITLGDPLPLGVDVTPGAVEALSLAPGTAVWASVKATELQVHPA